MTNAGFDALVNVARGSGCAVDLRPPVQLPPDTMAALGLPLDPELAAVYRDRADGGRIWDLFLHASAGESVGLVDVNESARSSGDDEPRLSQVIEFAQLGYQATYLATFPGGASPDGHQPVLYLDLNEGWIALPLASSVDRAFALLARYLERLAREHGEAADNASATFPWDAPDLVEDDAPLRAAIAAGTFDAVVYPTTVPDVAEWLARIQHRDPSAPVG